MRAESVRSLVDLAVLRAQTLPDRCAYRFLADGERDEAALTYAELDRRARSLAVSIRERVEPGAAIVLAFPAGLDFIVAFFACLYAGAVAVPVAMLHPRRGNERLASIIADCQAKSLLTTAAGARTLDVIATTNEAFKGLTALVAEDSAQDASAYQWECAATGDALAFLQYTSGSTQSPRGVCISHANVLANLHAIHAAEVNGAHSRGLSWLPHYHDMGLIEGLLQPLYGGYPTWLMSPAAFLQRPARWLQGISKFGVSVSGGPNFAFDLCVRRLCDEEIGQLDLSRWEVAYCGAEPVRAQTLDAFARRFEACGFRRAALRPVYGLAEATLLVAASAPSSTQPRVLHADAGRLQQGAFVAAAPDSSEAVALVSCGAPVTGVEIAIVDSGTQTHLAPGLIGEIWVSAPSVASGYRRATDAAAFVTCECNGVRKRWLRTGDLGFITGGELVVAGRTKDLIIVRGRKLHPQDLEYTVASCLDASVANAAAAFALDGAEAEAVGICVEVSPACEYAQHNAGVQWWQELADRIRDALYRQHEVAIASLGFVRPGALARTSSGKLMRYRCRRDFEQGRIALLARFDAPAPAAFALNRAA